METNRTSNFSAVKPFRIDLGSPRLSQVLSSSPTTGKNPSLRRDQHVEETSLLSSGSESAVDVEWQEPEQEQ